MNEPQKFHVSYMGIYEFQIIRVSYFVGDNEHLFYTESLCHLLDCFGCLHASLSRLNNNNEGIYRLCCSSCQMFNPCFHINNNTFASFNNKVAEESSQEGIFRAVATRCSSLGFSHGKEDNIVQMISEALRQVIDFWIELEQATQPA